MDARKVAALVAVVGVGAVGVAFAKPPTRPSATIQPAYYVDAADKFVGTLGLYGVNIRLDGYVFKLSIDSRRIESNGVFDDSYIGWYEEGVFFEQPGCLGDPYVGTNQDTDGQITYGAVVRGSAPDQFTLYLGDKAKGRSVLIGSSLSEGACYDGSPYGSPIVLYPVVATYDLDAMFKLPLRPK